MSGGEQFRDIAELLALGLLCLSFLVAVFRFVVGPTLPDRVLALDLLVTVAIGFLAVIGIRTGFTLYLDIAIALALVGFLATVALARFILSRGPAGETSIEEDRQPDIERPK
ncbi:MAG: cation:proton antiporter [Rhizobiaceae bacterium]|nr:cation:proton antiporter [Rhizobiaceae bacterium]